MAKTNESSVWDQDLAESGCVGSGFMKRTANVKQMAAKVKVVRDDWDDDDDEDEDEGDEGESQGVQETYKADKAKASGNRTDGTVPDPGPTARREQAASERYDDNDEESSKIWEAANKRAPMPELIVAPASTSQSFPPPPPAAFQPTLRILKRPSPNASASANNVGATSSASSSGPASNLGSGWTSPAPPRGTLAEREAQYQEARSRIFGDKEVGIVSPGSMSRTSSSSGGVAVARDPLGPASETELDPGMGGQDRAHSSDRPAKGFGERRRGKK